jgi:hypothetical protein
VPGPGWFSAHLHGEFLDVMRFDGPDAHVPTRWVAWAHPATLYGSGPVDAAGLSPEAAAAAVEANDDLEASSPRPFEFAELKGEQLDVHTDSSNVPVFGGPDGDFGLEPAHDARLGFVTIGEELVIVMCLGAPTELDAACADVQPILDSVAL